MRRVPRRAPKPKGPRPPAVAGLFYPDQKESLAELLDRLSPRARGKERALAAVVPHGSLFSCGRVLAAVYGALELPPVAVVVGPNHSGAGEGLSVAADGEWETPLGRVPVESGLARAFLKRVPGLKKDSKAHQYEHAAEVQLPFLQRWGKLRSFVPIALAGADLEASRAIGRGLAEALRGWGREALLVASTDLSRYEPAGQAEARDRELIEPVLALDEERFWGSALRQGSSLCGAPAVAAVLCAAKGLGASGATLVKYEVGGAVSGPAGPAVGYAGILIR